MSQNNYVEVPQPDELSTREKEDAMGAYLMMFASTGMGLPLPIVNLIAAVIYYFINRSKSRFVKFHTIQSLLSQLPTSFLNGVVVMWTFRNIYKDRDFTDFFFGFLAMVVVLNLIYIIFSLVAAVRARKGRFYYFLFFGQIAYHYAFLDKGEVASDQNINRPPA